MGIKIAAEAREVDFNKKSWPDRRKLCEMSASRMTTGIAGSLDRG